MSPNKFEAGAEPLVLTDSGWYLYCLFAGGVFAVTWRHVADGHRPLIDDPPLTTTEIACLAAMGGPLLAAMGQLRAAGCIRSNGRPTANRPLPVWFDQFTRQTLSRLRRRRFSVDALMDDLLDPLLDLEQTLVQRGYLHTDAEKRRIRFGFAPLVAICAAGIGAIPIPLVMPGVSIDTVIAGFFLPAVLAAIIVAFAMSVIGPGRLSPAGRRVLAAERSRAGYLAPKRNPAFATYGAPAVGLSIALFGASALRQFDAELAAVMSVKTEPRGPSGQDSEADQYCGSGSGGGGGPELTACGGGCGGGGGGCGGGGGGI